MNNKYLVCFLIFLFCIICIPQTSISQNNITSKVNSSAVQQQTNVTIKEEHQNQLNDGQNDLIQKMQVAVTSMETATKSLSNTAKKIKAEIERKIAENNVRIDSLHAIFKNTNQFLATKIDSSEYRLIKHLQAGLENQKQINDTISSYKISFIVWFLISFIFGIYIIKILNNLSFIKNTSKNIVLLVESMSSRLKEAESQFVELQTSLTKIKENDYTSTKTAEPSIKEIILNLRALHNDVLGIKQELCDRDKRSLTPEDIVAYNDAIRTFVNINNLFFDLRQYNTLITPFISCLAQGENFLPLIDLKVQPEEKRIEISLLIANIEQFLTNNKPAIERYLKLSHSTPSLLYKDCIRCPIGEIFDNDQDRNLLGDKMLDKQKVKSVFKLGFYFPDAKEFPYREKSLVI